MKKISFTIILFLYVILPAPFAAWAKTATIEIIQSREGYHAGESRPVLFRITVAERWYIHGDKDGSGEIIPTALTFEDTPYLRIKDIRFPEPVERSFEYLTSPIGIFSGEILVSASIVFSAETPSGVHAMRGSLSYQACSLTACRPPEDIPVNLSFTIVSGDTPTREINGDLFNSINIVKDNIRQGTDMFAPDKGLLWTLLLIFLGGLALNLSPCIYPMIPITVSYFGGKSGRMRGATLIHGGLYLVGLSFTNSLMGLASALSGNMLGSVLQHPLSLIVIAIIMVMFGLSFFDLWELRIPSGLNMLASRSFGGYFGTFFMGLTIGIIAAPCIGPFILGLVAYVGQKGDPFFGFLCFFILSMGMGLPICILALFSGAIKRLPLSGDWMLWIRRLMGWVLIAMAVYMVSPLISGQVIKHVAFLITAVASGIHLGWLDRAGKENVRFVLIKRISGIVILILAATYLYFAASDRDGILWQLYDESLLARAAQEGKPVILDFYADWCVPCKGLEKTVFCDPQVVLLSEGFIVMRVDLTKHHAFQDEILKRYKVIGVPTIIFLNGKGLEEKDLRVESMVEKDEFLSAMKRALQTGI